MFQSWARDNCLASQQLCDNACDMKENRNILSPRCQNVKIWSCCHDSCREWPALCFGEHFPGRPLINKC